MTDAPRTPELNPDERDAGLAPTPGYRYADRVGDTLYVAGQVPLDATGAMVGVDDAAAQATACLRNLETLVDVHGFAVGDVRRLVVHVVGDHAALRATWGAVVAWFDGSVPPATLLGAALLGYVDQIVEIDATVRRTPT